ncbi:L-galactose dehydrogenase-like [Homarus americanus]|uniref:L-galactose dehydrogenase-like n=1 Tax=Homarus americanus TaxID=6706 RepID=A0A8J5K266_HOMAM|nr:L-galactose dehydrogenase-like [Homarus americanus]
MDQLTYVANFHDDDAVKKMSYQPLGNTGLSVSRISLGGGPLGDMYGSNKEEEYIATVHLALKSGINYIDTAPWYGNDSNLNTLTALKDVPRSAYYIGTKVGRYEQDLEKQFDFSGKRVEQSVDASLKLLGLNYVDVIQVHDLEFAESLDIILEETLPALQKVVEQGKARHIGITGYPLHLLQEVIERSSINIELVLSYARNTLLDDTLKEFIPFFQNLDSVLTPPTPLEEKVALELKLKFFDPLPRKHWEGVGPAQYWKSLRQLRGELPQDD